MRLSTLLSRNILRPDVGRLCNRFKIRSRRVVFFFEDILSLYIKECEEAGYKEEMERAGFEWGSLVFQELIPAYLKNILPEAILTKVMRGVWRDLGLLDDLHVDKRDGLITLTTRGECITRTIGENSFCTGLYMGTFSALYNAKLSKVETQQNKHHSTYTFQIEDQPRENVPAKDKKTYDKLNETSEGRGYTLKDLLRKGTFTLDGSRVYFRGKRLQVGENTLFHIFGEKKVLLESIPKISYNYFKDMIEPDAPPEKKLLMLKHMLSAMGWGVIKILYDEGKVSIEIRNPPYGLQRDRDNWDFLLQTILGYLWLIDKNFRLQETREGHRYLRASYLCRA